MANIGNDCYRVCSYQAFPEFFNKRAKKYRPRARI